MCGVFGFFSEKEKSFESLFEAVSLQKHRGPDDFGVSVIDINITSYAHSSSMSEIKVAYAEIPDEIKISKCLFHQRLSILDLSHLSHQPITKDNITLTYNGEIFNFIELREELEGLGHTFSTSGDTEVVLTAICEWGDEAFSKFNGMWAIIYYDKLQNSVTLSRDRFGIKPLYYSFIDNELIIASEIKPIKRLLKTVSVNSKQLDYFISSCVINSDENTLINEIKSLEEGSIKKIHLSNYSIFDKKFWNLPTDHDNNDTQEEICNKVESFLLDSISLRLRADVPLGMLISGGLDSSVIAGIATKDFNTKILAYNADFADARFSEKKNILLNSENNPLLTIKFLYPESNHINEQISKIIHAQEIPFRSLSVFCQYFIYREISMDKNLKVVLNGQGSDEIFGGYTNHYFFLLWEHLLKFKISSFLNILVFLKEHRGFSIFKIIKSLLNTLALRFNIKFYLSRFLTLKYPKLNYNSLSLRAALSSNVKTSYLKELLHYEDRNSMNFSIESRLPFMDYRLVQYAFSCSAESLINSSGMNKAPLRSTAVDRIHPDIIYRKDKMGFVTPQAIWQETILYDVMNFEFENLDKRLNLHPQIRKKLALKKFQQNNLDLCWRIFISSRWLKEFIG